MLSRSSSFKGLNQFTGRFIIPKDSHNISTYLVPKTSMASTFEVKSRRFGGFSAFRRQNETSLTQDLWKTTKEKTKGLLHEFIHLIKHGSKSAFKDAKQLYSVVSSKSRKDYTVKEIREVKRITSDLIRFVPFYAAVLVPAGELALIPYLFLFPRAMPSYFIAETAIKENKDKATDRQFEAHQNLQKYLLTIMTKVGYDSSNTNPQSLKKFYTENREILVPLLDINQMNSETLKDTSDFLMFEYVEGTYIFNLLYATIVNLPQYGVNLGMWAARKSYRARWCHPIFTHRFKMNWHPFEGIKKQLIKYQLEKQMKTMRAQDSAIIADMVGEMKEEMVLDVAKERGYYTHCEESAKKWLKENWGPMAKTDIDNSMHLFWLSVIQYGCH